MIDNSPKKQQREKTKINSHNKFKETKRKGMECAVYSCLRGDIATKKKEGTKTKGYEKRLEPFYM